MLLNLQHLLGFMHRFNLGEELVGPRLGTICLHDVRVRPLLPAKPNCAFFCTLLVPPLTMSDSIFDHVQQSHNRR